MYSLVSAPVLGFDLSRLPGGSAVADVLLRSLSFTESDLDILSRSRLDDWDRLTLWQDVDAAAQQRLAVRDLATSGAEGDPEKSLAVLQTAPIGTVDGLLHCVRHDVLEWTWQDSGFGAAQGDAPSRATSVICDAVVAAYLKDELPADTRRRLAAGWLAAARWLPVRHVHLGPQHDAIRALLARIRTLHPSEIGRLLRAADATRRNATEWAPAVHAASWAVYVSERIRPAAAAQLMLVQAVDDAQIPVADRAAGVWNLISGAVQALAVRDLLAAETTHRLLDPFMSALGPNGLADLRG
jgi:hypothetical protein